MIINNEVFAYQFKLVCSENDYEIVIDFIEQFDEIGGITVTYNECHYDKDLITEEFNGGEAIYIFDIEFEFDVADDLNEAWTFVNYLNYLLDCFAETHGIKRAGKKDDPNFQVIKGGKLK